MIINLLAGVFGNITPPAGVSKYNTAAGGIGIIPFASNLIRIFTVVMGFWVMYNIIMAGFDYITGSGDTAANTKVKDRLTMSVVGLVIVISAYTIAGIIGLIFFGSAGFILSPILYSATP